jgi:hypothetical protein
MNFLSLNHFSDDLKDFYPIKQKPIQHISTLGKLMLLEEAQMNIDIANYDKHFFDLNFYISNGNSSIMFANLHIKGSNESRPQILIGSCVYLRPVDEDIYLLETREHLKKVRMFELQGVVINYQLMSETATIEFITPTFYTNLLSSVEICNSIRFHIRFSFEKCAFSLIHLSLRNVLQNASITDNA